MQLYICMLGRDGTAVNVGLAKLVIKVPVGCIENHTSYFPPVHMKPDLSVWRGGGTWHDMQISNEVRQSAN